MSWYNTCIPILRSLIQDFDCDSYSDERLLTILVHGAYLVQQEANMVNTYTIDISNETILPDPLSDKAFLNLAILKSHYIIAIGEFRKSNRQAVRVVDGPSTIDLSEQAVLNKDLLKNIEARYKSSLLQYNMGTNNPGQAVLSPYTQESLWTL